jgi:hypothetical protein
LNTISFHPAVFTTLAKLEAANEIRMDRRGVDSRRMRSGHTVAGVKSGAEVKMPQASGNSLGNGYETDKKINGVS